MAALTQTPRRRWGWVTAELDVADDEVPCSRRLGVGDQHSDEKEKGINIPLFPFFLSFPSLLPYPSFLPSFLPCLWPLLLSIFLPLSKKSLLTWFIIEVQYLLRKVHRPRVYILMIFHKGSTTKEPDPRWRRGTLSGHWALTQPPGPSLSSPRSSALSWFLSPGIIVFLFLNFN